MLYIELHISLSMARSPEVSTTYLNGDNFVIFQHLCVTGFTRPTVPLTLKCCKSVVIALSLEDRQRHLQVK